MKEWKLDAAKMDSAKAKYFVGHDPNEAKQLLAQAGFAKGFVTPLFHWPGYSPPWRSYYELAADNSHPPYVKGFKHHDGFGLGMRLIFTWLDR